MRLISKNKIVYYISFLLCAIKCFPAMAQSDPAYTSLLSGDSIKVGKVISVSDTVFFSPTLKPTILRTNAINNIISLRVNEYSNVSLPDSFKLDVRVRLIYVDKNNLQDSTLDTLSIVYNKLSPYKVKDIRHLQGAYQMQVKVLDVTATYATIDQFLSALELENKLVINRDYVMNPVSGSTMNCTANAITQVNISSTDLGEYGELQVSWPIVKTAEHYDLEWTFIDKSALDDQRYGNPSQPNAILIFKNNATRISTIDNTYMIPMLYSGTGTLFTRVRAVQVGPDGEFITTVWSSNSSQGLGKYNITEDAQGHEWDLNWQATTSFAEDAKRKSVVQYYDGSLRSRQTVTRDNTTKTTVVAETLYDKQGRPVIQVLPAPTLSKLIAFTANFNVADINGREYDKGIYDTLSSASDYCDKGADSMSVASGASQYYSDQNPLLNSDHNQFIPAAYGYAFTETKYTQDNTGRINKQGGVGKEFQIGKGHETKYYYGTPEQTDLDALFGTEVGDASHYQKNMVRDANGQYSVSYVDMHGRTVATALAGKGPNNLQQLTNYRDSIQTEQLLSPTNNIIDGTSIRSSKSLLVSKAGDHTLSYGLATESLTLEDCRQQNICYDCLYDLTITITDDCNNQLLDNGVPVIITKRNFKFFEIDTTCNIATPLNFDSTIYFKEGSYNISKTLSINREGMQFYKDSIFLKHNTCRTYEDFLEEQKQIVASEISCNVIAEPAYEYESYRQDMLSDLMPLIGQYGDTARSSVCYSIFNKMSNGGDYQWATDYVDEEGNPSMVVNSLGILVSPQQLTKEEFISNFNTSWTNALLRYHPEYSLWEKYQRFENSHKWDDAVRDIDTYQEAKTKGYLNPTGNTSRQPANRFTNTLGKDPLITAYAESNAAKTDLENELFDMQNIGGSMVSLWGMATASTRCAGNGKDTIDRSCIIKWSKPENAFNEDSLCEGDLDMAWRFFKSVYLSKKHNWLINTIRGPRPLVNAPCLPIFVNTQDLITQGGFTGTAEDSTKAKESVKQFYADNCQAYASRWWGQLQNGCYSYTSQDSAKVISYLIEVCKEGSDIDHPYGSSSTSSTSVYRFKNFEQVIKFYNDSTGRTTDVGCNAFLIDQPLPYNKSVLKVDKPIFEKPEQCECENITRYNYEYGLNTASYSSFSNFMLKKYKISISQNNLQALLTLCATNNSCRFIPTPITLPAIFQCGAISEICQPCSVVKPIYDSFFIKFPGAMPAKEEPDTVQQHINQVFAAYMNQHLGFSKQTVDYLQFLEQCNGNYSGSANQCNDSSLACIIKNYSQLYNGISIDNLKNGMLAYIQGVSATNSNLDLGQRDPHYDYSYDGQTWQPAYTLEHPWQSATNVPSFNFSTARWIGGNDINRTGTFYIRTKIFVAPTAVSKIKANYYTDDADQPTVFVNGQQTNYRPTHMSNAYIPNLKPGWNEIVWEAVNNIGLLGFAVYFKADSLGPLDCKQEFATYYNQQKTTNYSFVQIDSVSLASTGKALAACGGTCNDMNALLREFQEQFIRPATGYVDLDMRTFAGGKTLPEGPKGVFDVNGKIIGNTVSGSFEEINQSFAQIWNSSNVNSVVGYLSSLPTGQFRLQLKPGKTAPCDGIVGMRYYQFDVYGDTINYIFTGTGSYVDFGDGNQIRVNDLPNDNINWVDRTQANVGWPDTYERSGNRYHRYYIRHYYPPVGVTRTATVYHSDVQGSVGFDGGLAVFKRYRDIRGYFPQELHSLIFHTSQDSTLHDFSRIKNFNQIQSILHINLQMHGNALKSVTDIWFPSFANNHGMRTLVLETDNINVPQKMRPVHDWLPDLPINFPNLGFIYIRAYDSISCHKLNFSLPNLRALWLVSGLSGYKINPKQIDSIIIQVARSSRYDSGYISFHIPDGTVRTTASDAAVNNLIARKWLLVGAGMSNTGSVVNYTGPVPATQSDSLPITSAFTEFINQRLLTKYSYNQVKQLFSSTCSDSLKVCDVSQPPPPVNSNEPVLCGNSLNGFPNLSEGYVEEDPCSDSTNIAIVNATELYRIYSDSLSDAFEEQYQQKCLNAAALESFTITHPVSEYHYTLYYYDLAGNLIKTVPPAGVNPNRNPAWLQQVQQKRKTQERLVPEHALPTVYRYNSLNQVVTHKSPDGGFSEFWYDKLGRLAVSRNGKQRLEGKFSYTLYDSLGRIREVGQKKQPTAMTKAICRDTAALNNWFRYLYTSNDGRDVIAEEVTSTVYDAIDVFASLYSNGPGNIPVNQKLHTLRNRVSYSRTYEWLFFTKNNYYDPQESNTINYNTCNFSTTYSYDILGNVDTVLNMYFSGPMSFLGNGLKVIAYKYDLISGKVNQVHYQPGWRDQIYHRYEYDAENRLTDVYVTDNKVFIGDDNLEDHEAHYDYYKHGPLARTVLGQQQVQGVDYAYSLQGWLKGVNSSGLSESRDMGGDGLTVGNIKNKNVGKDAYGFNLNYFTGDYAAISGKNMFPGHTAYMPTGENRELYNGNISSMAVNIGKFNQPQLYNYQYDQLNRLVGMDAYRGFNTNDNNWSALAVTNEYQERVSYDGNGNILSYKRNGNAARLAMDDMTYSYKANSNQLDKVVDVANDAVNAEYSKYNDIKGGQNNGNYTYDSIGNLIKDNAEKITDIKWSVYGKITWISKIATAGDDVEAIAYYYDAAGNRIAKYVKRLNTPYAECNFYVRDAAGNVMATYSYTGYTFFQYPEGAPLSLTEQHLYGSSRLGVWNKKINMLTSTKPDERYVNLLGVERKLQMDRGNKLFELSNHLGNVLVTISDKKIGVDASSDGTIDYYTADVTTANDYYPFGMTMPGRNFNSDKYRYGFNGKEKDKDISVGDLDFGARIYDGRLGKWLSLDPLQARFPGLSPYNFCYNSPLNVVDPDGKLGIHVTVQYNSATKTYTVLSITIDDDLKAMPYLNKAGNPCGEYRDLGMNYFNYAEITFVDGNGKVTSKQNKTLSFRTNNWTAGKWWAKKKVDDGDYEDYGGVAWTSQDGGNEETRKGRPSHASNIELLMTALSATKGHLEDGFSFTGLEFLEKLTSILEKIPNENKSDYKPMEDPSIKKDLDELKKMLSSYEENNATPSATNSNPNPVKRTINAGTSPSVQYDPNDGKVRTWTRRTVITKPGLDSGKPDTITTTNYTRPKDKSKPSN